MARGYVRNRYPFHPGKFALKALPPVWDGGYDFRRPHPFKAHDAAAGSQCGRCWGWVDDPRHLFHPTET